MNGKTPISALQELMARQGLPLPVYTEEGFGSSFKCTVRASGVVASGIASTKKAAKHESARSALEKLQNTTSRQIIVLESSFPVATEPLKNYVGELNEFSSKNGLQYPDYDLSTCNLTQFVCKCSFQGKETLGVAKNKKDAKQDSARKMLILTQAMEPVTFIKTTTILEQKHLDDFKREKIFSIYKNLTLNDNRDGKENSDTLKAIPEIFTNPEDSVEILERKLRGYGVLYNLKEIQRGPMVMSAKIVGTDLFFLGTGCNREEATKSLLQDILMVAKSGCSLSTNDLISFN